VNKDKNKNKEYKFISLLIVLLNYAILVSLAPRVSFCSAYTAQ